MIAVSLRNVNAGYRGTVVLKDITFEVPDGRIVGLSGPNGSGKTTLLRVIQGTLPITSGLAQVLGVRLARGSSRGVQRQIACAFQTMNVDPRMPISAQEVVMMGRYARLGLLKGPGDRDREVVSESLARVDAVHLARRPFGQLSGGEQQRVHLARALAQEPRLLLLDEPTTFLDSESQQRTRDVIRDVHSRTRLTTIVVSHDADVLADLCDQILVMERGRIERVISSRELADV